MHDAPGIPLSRWSPACSATCLAVSCDPIRWTRGSKPRSGRWRCAMKALDPETATTKHKVGWQSHADPRITQCVCRAAPCCNMPCHAAPRTARRAAPRCAACHYAPRRATPRHILLVSMALRRMTPHGTAPCLRTCGCVVLSGGGGTNGGGRVASSIAVLEGAWYPGGPMFIVQYYA